MLYLLISVFNSSPETLGAVNEEEYIDVLTLVLCTLP